MTYLVSNGTLNLNSITQSTSGGGGASV